MSPSPSRGPGVLELRMMLDYGNPKLARCKSFYEECRVFAKRFLAPQQDPDSTPIQDRKGRRHFTGQNELAEAFLTQGDRGNLYWPSDKKDGNYNRLQYKQHAPRIKRFLGDLLFKIYQQAEQNARYKEKNRAKPGAGDKPKTVDMLVTKKKLYTCQGQPISHSLHNALGSSINNPIDLEDDQHKAAMSAVASHHEGRNNSSRPFQLPEGFSTASGSSGVDAITSTGESPTPKSPHHPLVVGPKIEDSDTTDLYSGPNSPIFPTLTELLLTPSRRSPKPTNDPQPRLATSSNAASAKTASPENSKRTGTADISSQQKRQKRTGTSQHRAEPRPEHVPERRSDRVRYQKYESLYFPLGEKQVSRSKDTRKGNSALTGTTTLAPASSVVVSASTMSLAEDVNASAADIAAPENDRAHSGEKESRLQTCETMTDLEEQRRVPVAPMEVASALPPVALTPTRHVASRLSPPAPELGTGHRPMELPNFSPPRTQTVMETAAPSPGRGENARVNMQTPAPASPSDKGEATPPQRQLEHAAQKDYEPTPPSKLLPQGPTSQMITFLPSSSPHGATLTQQPDVRIVVISRRPKKTRSYWTPTDSLRSMSLAQLKKEIPLALSPDFCGFKFGFVCPDSKAVREIQDGNELEFEHMKMDMFESIDEYMEEMEGSGAAMVFQLRVEEMTHPSTLKHYGSRAQDSAA